MTHSIGPDLWGAVLALCLGGTAIVCAALLAARLSGSAFWERSAWQAALLAIFGLVIAETTGMSQGIIAACRRAIVRPAPVSEAPLSAGSPVLSAQQRSNESPLIPQAFLAAETFASPEPWLLNDSDAARSEPPLPQTSAPAVQLSSSVADPADVPNREQWVLRDRLAGGFAALWALVGAAVLLRFVLARVLLARFRVRHPCVVDPLIHTTIARLARQLGLRGQVSALTSENLSAPVAFGIVRPTVVLPSDFSVRPQSEQEAMLAHELAHLASRDPLWMMLADVLCAVLWWHPAVWWSRCSFCRAAELAADEASLLVPGGPDVLAECLVRLGRRLADRRSPGWVAFGGTGRTPWLSKRPPGETGRTPWLSTRFQGSSFRSGLGRRVERLLWLAHRPWRSPTLAPRLLAGTALAMVCLIPAVSCTAWAHPQADLFQGDAAMKDVLRRSWRRSLAAMVAAAVAVPIFGAALADDREGDDRDRPPAAKEGPRDPGPAPKAAPERRGPAERPRAERPEREGRRGDEAAQQEREAAHREREEARRRLEDLKARSEEARRAGREEEADRLMREAEAIHRRFERPGDQPPPERKELERRLHHLEVAADNLRAAGFPEYAERIMQEAQRLREGGGGPRGPLPPFGRGLPGLPAPEEILGPRPDGPPPGLPTPREQAEHIERTMREFRRGMEALGEQLGEMRRHLERLTERVERGER